MSRITETLAAYRSGALTKAQFIRAMYERHHAVLFDYAAHLPATEIRRIEIEDGRVIMTTREHGLRFIVPPGDLRVTPVETLNFLAYEPAEGRMLQQLLPDGGVFFDIGANVGWYGLHAARAHPTATIHCFEPLPPTFATLQQNLALNAVHNVTAHPFGFSDREDTLAFYYDPEGSGNASSENLTDRADLPVYRGVVRTLDAFVAERGGGVDLIKCDVEGAELLVFRGGAQTIATHRPAVCCEILRKWSARFGYDPNQIFAFFSALGYRAYVLRGRGLHPFGVMDETTVETNFVFLHGERHAAEIRRLVEG